MFHASISAEKANIQSFAERFHSVRAQTMHLVDPLETEDFVVQPTMDVSPPKWHMAHTTWFFETFILKPQKTGYQLYDEQFPYLFNSYYVTAGERWSRAERGFLTRPTVDEIIKYRKHVDQHIEQWLDGLNELTDEIAYTFEIGLQHEQQHQELLLYDIKQILGDNPIFARYTNNFQKPEIKKKALEWLSVDEGVYHVGYEGDGFFFDNEKTRHPTYILPFEIGSRLVTNEEYLEFVESGGYSSPGYWMMDGFEYIQSNNIAHPKYWIKLEGEWYAYQLTGLEKLDLNAPVAHVSFYEADAYARWKGLRLPTEFEWEVAAQKYSPEVSTEANFVEDQYYRPIGSSGMFGDLWEWTASAYRPYPHYEAPEGALGEYNGKFMINQMVLRGGSYATPRNHIRHTYRNFFHPHLQWLLSGIRLARFK